MPGMHIPEHMHHVQNKYTNTHFSQGSYQVQKKNAKTLLAQNTYQNTLRANQDILHKAK